MNLELLDQIVFGMVRPDIPVNENFIAARPAAAFGRIGRLCIGLQWAYYGGLYMVADTPTVVPGAVINLTDNVTTYIRISDAGIVDATTSIPPGWPARYSIFTALHDVTTLSGAVTAWNEYRVSMVSNGALTLAAVLSVLGIDNWVITGSGPYAITITKGAYSTQLDLT